MGTIKSKYEIGRDFRHKLSALYNNLIQKYSGHGWELISKEPPGANNYMTNRADMAKHHGDVTRETGNLGLTYNATLCNKGGNVELHFKVELLFHRNGRSNNVQIKATDTIPVLSKVLAFAHKRLYIYAWGRAKDADAANPDAFIICSGKRLTIDRLSATQPKGDKNQVRANFRGLSTPVFRLKPSPNYHVTTPNNLMHKIIKEVQYKGRGI